MFVEQIMSPNQYFNCMLERTNFPTIEMHIQGSAKDQEQI